MNISITLTPENCKKFCADPTIPNCGECSGFDKFKCIAEHTHIKTCKGCRRWILSNGEFEDKSCYGAERFENCKYVPYLTPESFIEMMAKVAMVPGSLLKPSTPELKESLEKLTDIFNGAFFGS